MDITYDFSLKDENKEKLCNILECSSDDQLKEKLSLFGKAALNEYVSMILGEKVFTRGSDFLEFRLYQLIVNAFDYNPPDQYVIANLFQKTSTASAALRRNSLAKYQHYLDTKILFNKLLRYLEEAEPNEEESRYKIPIQSEGYIERLNDIRSRIDVELAPVRKSGEAGAGFIILADVREKIINWLKERL